MVKPAPSKFELQQVVREIRTRARHGQIYLSNKSIEEAQTLQPPADADDIAAVLLALTIDD